MIVPIRLVETAHFKDQDRDELDQRHRRVGFVRRMTFCRRTARILMGLLVEDTPHSWLD